MKLKTMFFHFVVLVSAEDCKAGKLGIDKAPCSGTTKNIKCDYGVDGEKTTVCCEKSDGWVAVGPGSGMEGEAVWKSGTKSGIFKLSGPNDLEVAKSGKIEVVDNDKACCFSMKTPKSKKKVTMQWALHATEKITKTDFNKKHKGNGRGTFELDLTKTKGDKADDPATGDSEVTTPGPKPEAGDDDSDNTFMIVAAAGGGGLLLVIVVIVVYCCYCNKPKKEIEKTPFAEDQNKKKTNVSITSSRR